MQLTTLKKAMATAAVFLGVLVGAAGVSAAVTGTQPAHRQVSTAQDVPEANDTTDSVDVPGVNDVPDSPDTPEAGDHTDTPATTVGVNTQH